MSNEPAVLMSRCQRKALFVRDGQRVKDWTEALVAEIPRENPPEVRCAYCHGAVRLHRQQVEHGPADHAEHLSRQDSERCQAGFHFQGEHKMSLNPVR